jgi:membrane-associated phospholipid phosphatase
MKLRTIILAAIWIIALIIAVFLDVPVARFVHENRIDKAVTGWWPHVIKAPGHIFFTLGVAGLLWLFRRTGWRGCVFVMIAGAVSSINVPIKWIVGRTRPYKLPGGRLHPFELHPFRNGIWGLFHESDLCFPSGHAITAFTLSAAIAVVWPGGFPVFFILALCVGVERIAENAHFCSDVVGAGAIGFLCVQILRRILQDWLKPPKRQGFPVMVSPAPAESGTLRA